MALAVKAMIGRCLPVVFSSSRMVTGRLDAVHFRHVDIHQHDVERLPFQQRQGLLSGIGYGDAVPTQLQKTDGDLLVHDSVLRQQDAQGWDIGRTSETVLLFHGRITHCRLDYGLDAR